jgi:hypothetical protein
VPIVASSATTDDDAHFSFVDDGAAISRTSPGFENNNPGGNFDPCAPPQGITSSTSTTLAPNSTMHPYPNIALVDNEFINQYRDSINPVIEMIEKQISRSTWCRTNFQVHPHASDEWLGDISAELRKIRPSVEELASINRGNINKYPELIGVIKCHSRSGDYLVHFFKQPSEAPCNCVACRAGLWSPFMLNQELDGSLPYALQVPLPIPLPDDVGEPQVYMPLELARLQEFTTRH